MTNLLSRRLLRQFLSKDPTLSSIYEFSPAELNLHYSIPMKTATHLYQTLRDPHLRKIVIDALNTYKIITIVDETYPAVLRTIKDAPMVLYCLGDIEILKQNKLLSVIGSRKPSMEARPKMDYILTPLVKEHWVIVSGMARGIDGYAHELALKLKGRTIAILGGGFEYIYPSEHIPLFKEIVQTGLVISEYPPFTKPARYHFPERNRIISGLSFGTLVIEAMEKSGTMITVDQALEQGREVFAVPGSPLIQQTKGCHLLIQEGAKLTHHANDIREEWLRQQEYGKENTAVSTSN